jgi:acyl carrier protein
VLRTNSPVGNLGLLAEVLPEATPNATVQEFRSSWLQASARERPELMLSYLRRRVGQVLGFGDTAPLEGSQKLFEAGMDSLSALELRTRVQQELGCPLPATVVFDYPTLETLGEYLTGLLSAPAAPAAGAKDRLQELSEAELDELLTRKLDAMEQRLPR